MSGTAQEHLEKGFALSMDGRLQEAETELRAALLIQPDFALAHNNLGHLLSEQGKLEEAVGELREAIRIKPQLRISYGNLGSALKRQERYDEAIVAYRAELEYEPRCASAYSNIGLAYQEAGDLFLAIAHYRKALEFEPEHAIVHTNLGIALLLQGDVEVAIVEQRKAVSLAPTLAKTHYNLGNALSRGTRENWEPSAEAFQTAVILAPEWRTARVCLANALGRVGRFDEAIAEYQQVLHLAPNDEESWIQLGLILFMRALKEKSRGAAETAKEAFEHALAVNPHNRDASKLLRDVKNSLRVRHRFRWPWTK